MSSPSLPVVSGELVAAARARVDRGPASDEFAVASSSAIDTLVAEDPTWLAWKPGAEFRAVRDSMLAPH